MKEITSGALPEMAQLDARRFGRGIVRQFPELKNNVALARELSKIIQGQICKPKPNGRPPKQEITAGERLLRKYRKQYSRAEKELWARICAEVLAGWNDLRPRERVAALRKLKNQINARRSARRRLRKRRRLQAQEMALVSAVAPDSLAAN